MTFSILVRHEIKIVSTWLVHGATYSVTEAGRENSMRMIFLPNDFMTSSTRNSSRNLSVLVAVLFLISASCTFSFAQRPGGRRGSRGRSEASLSEPYRGIRSGGTRKGLFRIESTGVSTQPVVDAAVTFLNGLNDEQRNRTTFPVDDIEWRSWDNRHFYKRRGVGFDEMDEQQRKHAFALLSASLSAKGLTLSKDIMKLNGTSLNLLTTLMNTESGSIGSPSWEILHRQSHGDGRSTVIISSSIILFWVIRLSCLQFLGSEPVHAVSGKFKGTVVMQDEQDKGLAFMRSLDEGSVKKRFSVHSKNRTMRSHRRIETTLILSMRV